MLSNRPGLCVLAACGFLPEVSLSRAQNPSDRIRMALPWTGTEREGALLRDADLPACVHDRDVHSIVLQYRPAPHRHRVSLIRTPIRTDRRARLQATLIPGIPVSTTIPTSHRGQLRPIAGVAIRRSPTALDAGLTEAPFETRASLLGRSSRCGGGAVTLPRSRSRTRRPEGARRMRRAATLRVERRDCSFPFGSASFPESKPIERHPFAFSVLIAAAAFCRRIATQGSIRAMPSTSSSSARLSRSCPSRTGLLRRTAKRFSGPIEVVIPRAGALRVNCAHPYHAASCNLDDM